VAAVERNQVQRKQTNERRHKWQITTIHLNIETICFTKRSEHGELREKVNAQIKNSNKD